MAESKEPILSGSPVAAAETSPTIEVAEVRDVEPVRNVPLILLAVFASIFFLDWAQAFFLPLALGLMVSYALAPLVDRLQKLGIPRGLSAAVLLLAIVGGVATTALALRDEAVNLIEILPEAVQKFRQSLGKEFADHGETMEKVEKAAQEFERATLAASSAKAPPGVTRVLVEKPKLNVREYLLTNVVGAASLIGLSLIVLFLAYFLLASGNAFRRKWVQLSGPTLSRKKITIQVLDEIAAQIQRYLGVQVLTSAIVGLLSGLAFWAIGLENAAIWGIAAGVLNMVPYVGAIVTTGGTALVAFLQFGTVGMTIAVAGITLVVNALEGAWLTPWLSGRASRINAVVIFAGLLFWGWLWGGWGLVLGLPIMMVVKAICDHVEDFKPIGEFMAE